MTPPPIIRFREEMGGVTLKKQLGINRSPHQIQIRGGARSKYGHGMRLVPKTTK